MAADLDARASLLLGDPPETGHAYSAPAEDDGGDWFTTIYGVGDFVCRLWAAGEVEKAIGSQPQEAARG